MSAPRDIESHNLLDRFDPDQAVRHRRDVVEPIPVRRDHRVHAILGNLLHTAMEVADVAVEIDYGLAVELKNHTQHAVRRRMLRPHVERHLWRIQKGFSSGGYFDLMHLKNQESVIRSQGPALRLHRLRRLADNTRSRHTARSLTRSLLSHLFLFDRAVRASTIELRSFYSTRFAERGAQSGQSRRTSRRRSCQRVLLRNVSRFLLVTSPHFVSIPGAVATGSTRN